MGTQGEIYVVLGKRFPVERADLNPSEDDEPRKLLYKLNEKIIAITEDHPKNDSHFLDGFFDTPYNDLDISELKLGVKVLRVDLAFGDNNHGKPIEALVGYGVANESYAGLAKALPPMDKLISLRPRLVRDIKSQFDIDVPISDLELHLLYESSQLPR